MESAIYTAEVSPSSSIHASLDFASSIVHGKRPVGQLQELVLLSQNVVLSSSHGGAELAMGQETAEAR